jgi:hypothetical protein
MNENAKEWVAALRSGAYQQTAGRLRRGDNFCCLGVACDLFMEKTGAGSWVKYEHAQVRALAPTYTFQLFDISANTALPDRIVDFYGLSNGDGHYSENDMLDASLASENDSGRAFSEIADILEAEPEGLFVDENSESADLNA